MSYQTVVTAKDADLPLSLAEAKEHLRIVNDDQDAYVYSLLEAATDYCESATGRALRVSHTLTQKYDGWPCNPIRFDRQPVTSITHVKYYPSGSASLSTVTSTEYRLQTSTNAAAYLEFDSDYVRPSLDSRDDAVTITYVAGYATIAAVPAIAKHAVRLTLEQMFYGGETNQSAINGLLNQLSTGAYR